MYGIDLRNSSVEEREKVITQLIYSGIPVTGDNVKLIKSRSRTKFIYVNDNLSLVLTNMKCLFDFKCSKSFKMTFDQFLDK